MSWKKWLIYIAGFILVIIVIKITPLSFFGDFINFFLEKKNTQAPEIIVEEIDELNQLKKQISSIEKKIDRGIFYSVVGCCALAGVYYGYPILQEYVYPVLQGVFTP